MENNKLEIETLKIELERLSKLFEKSITEKEKIILKLKKKIEKSEKEAEKAVKSKERYKRQRDKYAKKVEVETKKDYSDKDEEIKHLKDIIKSLETKYIALENKKEDEISFKNTQLKELKNFKTAQKFNYPPNEKNEILKLIDELAKKNKRILELEKLFKGYSQNPNIKEKKNEQSNKAKDNDQKLELEEVEKLQIKINELEKENTKLINDFREKAKNITLKAEEEIKKHKEQNISKIKEEEEEFKKYASQKLLESIIEPILNIELAVISGETQQSNEVNAYVQGFKMLISQLYTSLEDYGISKIEPIVGSDFIPELHYALSIEKKSSSQSNKIIKVNKKGIKLFERVIKPAVVIISK